jgi:thiol-disulfide isomerase/thioredoxin
MSNTESKEIKTRVKEIDYTKGKEQLEGMSFIKVGAKWCGPCKKIAPRFDELSLEEGNSYYGFFTLDTDKARNTFWGDLIDELDIISIPQMIFYNATKDSFILMDVQDVLNNKFGFKLER